MLENNQESIDLLQHLETVDLSTIDRSFPVLKEGTYAFTVEKFDTKENKARNGHNLLVTLKLEQEAPAADGKIIKPGFKLVDLISLVQTEKYNPLEKLADIQLATLGVQQKGFRMADYLGRRCICRVSIEKSDEFGDKNRIRYIKQTGTPIGSL